MRPPSFLITWNGTEATERCGEAERERCEGLIQVFFTLPHHINPARLPCSGSPQHIVHSSLVLPHHITSLTPPSFSPIRTIDVPCGEAERLMW